MKDKEKNQIKRSLNRMSSFKLVIITILIIVSIVLGVKVFINYKTTLKYYDNVPFKRDYLVTYSNQMNEDKFYDSIKNDNIDNGILNKIDTVKKDRGILIKSSKGKYSTYLN